ncbi:MAG: NF038132 family protein [Burkholderiales bacterium]|nr:NF038132 family protein [Burkholderiales bacterium]
MVVVRNQVSEYKCRGGFQARPCAWILRPDTTNDSKIQPPLFTVKGGETLSFYFNYVSSDGLGASGTYPDYAWARLLDGSGNEVAMLFAARTTATGDTVPGFNMLPPDATLNPTTALIIALPYYSPGGAGPEWTPLGVSSGSCYATGCGDTDLGSCDLCCSSSRYLSAGVRCGELG